MAQKRKRKERKRIPNIVDTLFRSNAQGQRTYSARTNTFSNDSFKLVSYGTNYDLLCYLIFKISNNMKYKFIQVCLVDL